MINVQKISRLVRFDTAFQIRVVVLGLVAALIPFLWGIIARQQALRKDVEARNAVCARLPEMELRKIQVELAWKTALAQAAAGKIPVVTSSTSPTKTKPDLVLEGILNEDGSLYALVNGEVKAGGDVVSGYRIVSLTEEAAVFMHEATGAVETLVMPKIDPALLAPPADQPAR